MYDFLVIGGGSGGVRAARRAAGLGKKTALFEEGRMGGTCVLRGCIPKKLMVYGSRFPEQMKLAKAYGWAVHDNETVKLDFSLQKKRRDAEILRLSSIYQKLLQESGVEIIYEKARFEKPGCVSAGGKTYQAKNILIATGSYSHRPPLLGVEHALTSDDIFKLEKIPNSLIIAGAGYIALEFAGIFQSLGSKVSLLCRRDKVLTEFDEDVRSFFGEQAQVRGLEIKTQFKPKEFLKTNGGMRVVSETGEEIEAEKALLALGRRPHVESLNLEALGIETSARGGIRVSSQFETTAKGIYAIGDCADTPFQLTPVALAEAEILVKNLFLKENLKMDYSLVPSAVFSNPPIGVVGLSEKQAIEEGIKIQIFESRFRPLKNTIDPSKTDEKIYMKMIVDQKTNKVLGCHIVGEDAPEIIQLAAAALKSGALKKDFDDTVGVHPSSAEELCTMREPSR